MLINTGKIKIINFLMIICMIRNGFPENLLFEKKYLYSQFTLHHYKKKKGINLNKISEVNMIDCLKVHSV